MANKIKLGGHVVVDANLTPIIQGEIHGYATKKDMIVLHETVSPDYTGLSDILQTSEYLGRNGLGVHGVVDAEGYLGWAYGHRSAILYHTASNGGNINTRAIGIELVSRVMLDLPDNEGRFRRWWQRRAQLDQVAQLLAYLSHVDGIPLVYTIGNKKGVTTHWSITRTYGVSGGHVDAWPRHEGGYFPLLRVLGEARRYKALWWPESEGGS